MSEEQVEVVREHIEAYRRQAIDKAVTRYVGAFEDYAYEVGRLTDLGSGAILDVVTETGRGKGSGAPVNRRFAVLYTVIDGGRARRVLELVPRVPTPHRRRDSSS